MKPPKCRVCGKEEWRHLCTEAAFPLTRVRLNGEDVLLAGAPKLTINGAFPVAKAVAKINPVTKLANHPKGKRGRPKVHASAAERQQACRARKKAEAQ